MAFWKNDDSFAPFNVPQVGPTIPAMPTPDAKDAEIAKLRADLDQARRDRNSAVECAEVLRGYVAEHKAALAAARAALDGYKSPEAAHNLAMRAIEESHRANRAEAALKDCRAALDGEREACDSWRGQHGTFIEGCPSHYPCEAASRFFREPRDTRCGQCKIHDARRAAEAKASRGGEGGA